MTARYEAYECTQCGGTGQRRNESQNLADRRAKLTCFCDGFGVVLRLRGSTPPWYAGRRKPEADR
jgi:hypothetical protein